MRLGACILGGCRNFCLPLAKIVCPTVDGKNKRLGTHLTFAFIKQFFAYSALRMRHKTCLRAGCGIACYNLFGVTECYGYIPYIRITAN